MASTFTGGDVGEGFSGENALAGATVQTLKSIRVGWGGGWGQCAQGESIGWLLLRCIDILQGG